ncbi:hypothetical protein ABZ929_10680 [Streptomyces physcomitrii]|uniref:hypothetical protein n=1 Tax=Streptomyces physcomitrii TaxID=2724184 RepID=UPI0033E77C9D
MHRISTTALLLAAFLPAAAGCVTVGPPSPGRAVSPSPDPAGPHGSARPAEILEAPAREALEYIGPRPTSPAPTAPDRSGAPAAPSASAAPPRSPGPALPTSERQLCALSDRWDVLPPDSRAARICKERYGS